MGPELIGPPEMLLTYARTAIHPHLRTTLWINGHLCVSRPWSPQRSTTDRQIPERQTSNVHTYPPGQSRADRGSPHHPQHLLLLLMLSL